MQTWLRNCAATLGAHGQLLHKELELIVLTTLLTGIVLAFVATGVVRDVFSAENKALYKKLVRLRPRHFAYALLSLTSTVVAMAVLWQIPVLRWGWWSMLGGTGNPVMGTSEATSSGLWLLVPFVMIPLFLVGALILAYREEEWFRAGAQRLNRLENFRSAVFFGLVHLIIGIPIAAALGLTAAGLVFTHVYLRSYRQQRAMEVTGDVDTEFNDEWFHRSRQWQTNALVESTLVHALHNVILVTTFLAILAATML